MNEHSKTKNILDSSGFVALTEILPDALMDIRYYSEYNFVGKRIDSYEAPVAYLTKEAAIALKKACDDLRTQGYRVKIFDAYRPQSAVNHFKRWVQDFEATEMKAAEHVLIQHI